MIDINLKHRMRQAYRQLAWRIFVYLKANPDVLNVENNREVFCAVREIQIRHRLKKMPKYMRDNVADIVDIISDAEAKSVGLKYFVAQEIMDLYRPSYAHNAEWKVSLSVILLFYEPEIYTKEIHELALAEDASETVKEDN